MKRGIICGLAVLTLALMAQSLPAADNVRIRLGTLAPKDTSFHKTLMQMGDKWKQATGGNVSLMVYTDGTMGGEGDMVRRMRLGQLQGAMLTVGGLLQIDESVTALQLMPMMFRSFEEFDFVQERMRPTLEKKFEAKGFVVLFWGDAGWVRFFSKKPGLMPDEFKRMKMFVWSGDARAIEVMKAVGVNAVPLEMTDILTGLQTGLVEAVPSIPVYALAGQFYGPASHMLDLNWTPLVGATVVSKRTWDSIPPAQRSVLLKAAAEAGEQIRKRARQEAEESIDAMKKRGLKVTPVSPQQLKEWEQFAETVYPRIRGKAVPAEMFDEVQRLLKEYRANGKAPAQ
ncbi:MAG: TRAP transporter substrate-binding protein DctP [Verrucomicrobiota bacterium]